MSSLDERIFGRHEFVQDNPAIGVPCIIILCLASVLGTFGNILILLSIAMTKKLKTMESILIVNLTLSDLYVTVVADPLSVVAKLEGEQFFASVPGLCQTVASLCTISCVTSMMTIAVMSVNRYFYICKQDTYKLVFTKRNSLLICCSLYGIGTVFVLLNIIGIGNHKFDRKSLECIWDRMATFPYTVAFTICLVWIPSVITGVCFLKIFVYVRNHRRKIMTQQNASREKKFDDRSFKLAKTLFIIYAVFVSCWAPYALLIAIDYEDTYPHELHVYITMFAHLHPSLNWLIYYLTNTHFADAYREIFVRCFKCKKINSVTQTTSLMLNGDRATRSPKISQHSHQTIQTPVERSPEHLDQFNLPGSVLPTIKSETETQV